MHLIFLYTILLHHVASVYGPTEFLSGAALKTNVFTYSTSQAGIICITLALFLSNGLLPTFIIFIVFQIKYHLPKFFLLFTKLFFLLNMSHIHTRVAVGRLIFFHWKKRCQRILSNSML